MKDLELLKYVILTDQIKELVSNTPNNNELGAKIRQLINNQTTKQP